MDRQQGIEMILRPLEHRLELERLDRLTESLDLPIELDRHPGIRIGVEELRQPSGIGRPSTQLLGWAEPAFQGADFLHDPPSPLLVVPEARIELLGFERRQPASLGFQVKESLAAR